MADGARPDVDIQQDIADVFPGYPPLLHDRSRMDVTVADGVITASGHVRTAQSREYFEREARKIPGVRGIDTSALYDDDTLRIQSGRATPLEVYTNVSYGAVVLTGEVPEHMMLSEIVNAVEAIPGVRKVIPNFEASR